MQQGGTPVTFGAKEYWVVMRQTPVLALTVTNVLLGFGSSWYNWLPQYLEQQKGFDLKDAGVWLALADYGSFLGALCGGFFADYLRNSPRFRGSQFQDVNWIRRTSMVFSRGFGGVMCFFFLLDSSLEVSPWLVVVLICIYNVIFEFVSSWSGPLCQDMSYKYAAAIQGLANTGSNITFYALSNNIIGPILDAGGCTTTNEPAVQPTTFWAGSSAANDGGGPAAAPEPCTIVVNHQSIKGLPHGVNYTCISTPTDNEQTCSLQHQLVKIDVTNAVEDPAGCHNTWQLLFLAMGMCCFSGAVVFYIWGSGNDLTAKIDRKIGGVPRGPDDDDPDQGPDSEETDRNGSSLASTVAAAAAPSAGSVGGATGFSIAETNPTFEQQWAPKPVPATAAMTSPLPAGSFHD
eukprot:SAG22_NODE_775_length_7293_cov_2.039199_4_plen_404_part_00